MNHSWERIECWRCIYYLLWTFSWAIWWCKNHYGMKGLCPFCSLAVFHCHVERVWWSRTYSTFASKVLNYLCIKGNFVSLSKVNIYTAHCCIGIRAYTSASQSCPLWNSPYSSSKIKPPMPRENISPSIFHQFLWIFLHFFFAVKQSSRLQVKLPAVADYKLKSD